MAIFHDCPICGRSTRSPGQGPPCPCPRCQQDPEALAKSRLYRAVQLVVIGLVVGLVAALASYGK